MGAMRVLFAAILALSILTRAFSFPASAGINQQSPQFTIRSEVLRRAETDGVSGLDGFRYHLTKRAPFQSAAVIEAAAKQSKPIVEASGGPFARAWFKTARFFHNLTPNWLRQLFKSSPPRLRKQPLPGWPVPVPPPNSGVHSPVHGSISPFASPSPIHTPKYKQKQQPLKSLRKSASRAYKGASNAAGRAGSYMKQSLKRKPKAKQVNPFQNDHWASEWPDLPPLGKSKYTDNIGAGSLRPMELRPKPPLNKMDPIPEVAEEGLASGSFRKSS